MRFTLLTPCVTSLQEKQQAREEQLADLQEQVQALQHRRRSLEVALKAAEQVRAHGGLLVSPSVVRAHSSTVENAPHFTDRLCCIRWRRLLR